MAQRLKRWETPRKSGRNNKGRGGSARQRQKAKQLNQLRTRLKTADHSPPPSNPEQSSNHSQGEANRFSLFLEVPLFKHQPF